MGQATDVITVMSEEEAFSDLARRGVGGPIRTTHRELARRWGRPSDDAGRMQVKRFLDGWEKRGLIARETQPGQGVTITIGTVNVTVNQQVNNTLVQAPVEARIIDVSGVNSRTFTPLIAFYRVIALALGGLGLYIAGMDGLISWNFGHAMGRTPEAAGLFAGIAWAVTAAGLVLPTAGMILWRAGHWVVALVAWGSLGGIVLPMAVLAAVGFMASNVADVTAERGKIANESLTLSGQVEQLTKERATIGESRSVAAIEAEIQAAQSQAPVLAVWSRTSGCKDVTQQRSGEACAPLLRLRQALGEAQRRDALDLELRDKQTRLADLPAITSADPQAEAAAGLARWFSLGALAPAASDFAMLRMALFAAVLLMPGVFEMLAASLWGIRS